MKTLAKLLIYLPFFITVTFVISSQTYAATVTVSPKSIDETTESVTITFSGLEAGGEYFFCPRSDGCFFDQDYITPVRANSAGVYSITVCGLGNDKVKLCESGDYFHQATYQVVLYPSSDPNPEDAIVASFEVLAAQCPSGYGYSSDLHGCAREAPPEGCDSSEESRTVLEKDICILTSASGGPGGGSGGGGGTIPVITGGLSGVVNFVSFDSVGDIIKKLLPFIFGLAAMLALLYLIWGGVRYMLARGDPKELESARGVLTSAVIGLIIVILAATLFYIVGSVFKVDIFDILQRPVVAPAHAVEPVDIGCGVKLAGGECIVDAFPTVGSLFTRIVRTALAIGAAVFLGLIVWGGIRYLNSGGDVDAATSARQAISGAVIGMLIIVGSFAIIELIFKAIGIPGVDSIF